MSLRSSVASGTDSATRTSGVIDHNAAYTVAFWVRIDTDPNDYTHFWAAGLSSESYQNADWIGTDNNGTTFRLGSYSGGSGSADATGTTNLVVGTDYHVAIVRTSTTNLDAYVNGVLDANVTTNVGSRSTANIERLFELNGFGLIGRITGFKSWQAALSADEIKQEMRTLRPVRFSNLVTFTPMVGNTVSAGLVSLVGTSWAEVGSLEALDGPSVSWGASAIVYPYAAAGGPTYNQSVAGSLSFTRLNIKSARKISVGALTFSGSATKSISKIVSGALTLSAVVVKQTVKLLAGVLTFAGDNVKRTDKIAAGTLSFTGAMSAIRTLLQAVTGVLSFASGTVSKSSRKSASGTLSFSGVAIKGAQKFMLGTLSFTGQSLKTISKTVSGVLAFAGTAVASLLGAVVVGALTALLKVVPALRANSKTDPALRANSKTDPALKGEPKTK